VARATPAVVTAIGEGTMGTPLHISKDLALDLESLIGQCVAVLGIRGSGKSNTAGVIFEELLNNNYPMSIVDIEGEYFGLKEKYEVLVVGTGDGVEIEIDAGCAAEIAEVSMEKNVPVVLDLSGFLSDERTELLMEYLSSLWNLAGTLRRPYIIGIEEAHEFIPQGVKTELKEMISRIALRGRKRGLGAIVVSQRSAKVEKDVLSQAGMLFLHRVVHEVDMRVYGELLPWRKSEVKEIITSLETGNCIFVNGETVRPIYVRERETFHAGFTPSLEVVATPELKQVSDSILEAIERAREGKGRRTRTQELEEQLAKLHEKLAERDARIAELEETARTLGYIKVEVPASEPRRVPVVREAGDGDLAPHRLGTTRRAVDDERAVERGRLAAETGWGVIGVAASESAAPEPPLPPPASSSTSPAPASSSTSPAEGPTSSGPLREAETESRISDLPPAVMRHMDRLVARIERRSLLERRVLAFLVTHAPGVYTASQIAAWTNCAREMIEDELPHELVEAGLIARERRTDGQRFQSRLKTYVSGEFAVYLPDIGQTGLHDVARGLSERLARVP